MTPTSCLAVPYLMVSMSHVKPSAVKLENNKIQRTKIEGGWGGC